MRMEIQDEPEVAAWTCMRTTQQSDDRRLRVTS